MNVAPIRIGKFIAHISFQTANPRLNELKCKYVRYCVLETHYSIGTRLMIVASHTERVMLVRNCYNTLILARSRAVVPCSKHCLPHLSFE